MPQFTIYSKVVENNHAVITDKEIIKHAYNVLRLKADDNMLLIDENEIAYYTRILDIDNKQISVEIIHAEKSKRKLNIQLDLLQCTLKSTAMDIVVQKVTELGIKNLYVMPSHRSVSKFNDKDIKGKLNKWKTSMLESCKQCERADKPDVHYIKDFDELKEHAENYDLVVACVERSTNKTLKEALKTMPKAKKILVVIGPEGGFEQSEIEFFINNKYETVSISNLIYRAETAAIAALSGVIYEYEL